MVVLISGCVKGTGGTLADFLVEYWPLIRPDGGMLLVHFTSGVNEGTPWRIDVKELALQLQLAKPEQMEQLNLVEPHKYRQGAVTMLRRVQHRVAPVMSSHPALRRTSATSTRRVDL